MDEREAVELLRERLRETVRTHLVSDVPVGAFLSGGMDSSMIVALMAQDLQVKFKTFAIGVNEQDFNELPFARTAADYHHTEHIESYVESDLVSSLPDMIWHLDEPSDPIAACQYHAAALAAETAGSCCRNSWTSFRRRCPPLWPNRPARGLPASQRLRRSGD